MSAQVISRTENEFTVQITVPYNRSMLDFEETLQQQLNAAGVLATQEGLRQFDTDGSPIMIGSIKLTSKGQLPKDYQTSTAWPQSNDTFTRVPWAGPPIAPWTATLGSLSALHPSSLKWSRVSTQNSARHTFSATSAKIMAAIFALPRPGHRRRRGNSGDAQGARLELSPAQDGDASSDRRIQLRRDVYAGVRGRLAGDDGGYDQLL